MSIQVNDMNSHDIVQFCALRAQVRATSSWEAEIMRTELGMSLPDDLDARIRTGKTSPGDEQQIWSLARSQGVIS